MDAKILDGKWLSECFQHHVKGEVVALRGRLGRAPGLGVILVGDNPASHAYVANKEKLARNCGLETFDQRLPALASREELRRAVVTFNEDPRVDGILLQLPLPRTLHQNEFLDLIDFRKDADGLTPISQGLLMRGDGRVRPCTPLGVMKLLDLAHSDLLGAPVEQVVSQLKPCDLKGKHAVVVGRSILVGKPVALMLLERGATVTVAHSKTSDLPAVCRSADIIVAAVGVPHLVKGEWVKAGAIVIDVGINRLPDGKLTGDVDFDGASKRAAAITPVPKGVGPMTVAMLIYNTLLACQASERVN